MNSITDKVIRTEIGNHPFNLLFATISGSHLYGFPSKDSDYDLRGAHILPAEVVVGLDAGRETVEVSEFREGLEIDLVTHDVRKFFELLLRKNGYVLEQLYSPLIVETSDAHVELKQIARGCITRNHVNHYLGFAANQWKIFNAARPRSVKPLLYSYRILLTGIYLMQTGRVEANLNSLNDEFKLPHIQELVLLKIEGTEKATLADEDISFHQTEYARLCEVLKAAFEASSLPEVPSSKPALNDLLVRVRLNR